MKLGTVYDFRIIANEEHQKYIFFFIFHMSSGYNNS